MNKTEKLRGCIALCRFALTNLNELSEALTTELKTLFRALEIEDQDTEKIQDVELYKIANDLEYNADNIKSEAKDLESVIEWLEKIKL